MTGGAGLIARTRPNIPLRRLARAARVDGEGVRRKAVRERIAAITDHEHVALTASGRGALLALLATSERPRAVIPGYTCKAVVEAARLAGVETELIDVSDGFNWDPEDLRGVPGPDRVVVLTHQYGIPGRVDELMEAARTAGALVIEDCAGGLGGRDRGRRLGSFGDAAFYSFDTSKLVHVPPKGGALTVADPGWAARASRWLQRETGRMRRLRKAASLGQAAVLAGTGPRTYHLVHKATLSARGRATTETPGLELERGPFYDAEFAEWQAEIALPQLDEVDRLAARARAMYEFYLDGLADCRSVQLPPRDEAGEWAPIRFPIRVRDKLGFYEALVRRGVDCAFSFTHLARREGLPRATAIADSVLCLPFYPGLHESEAERVIAAVRDVDARWRG